MMKPINHQPYLSGQIYFVFDDMIAIHTRVSSRIISLGGEAMGEEKIMTLHPQGKQGVNINKAKYDQMAQTIVDIVKANEGITFKALNTAVSAKLDGQFDGSIGWYLTTVKLDLEARNIIERIPNKSPQQLRLV